MIKLPIRLRLTAWYFAVLTVVLSVFGVGAYLEMRHSIHRTVDEELHLLVETLFRVGLSREEIANLLNRWANKPPPDVVPDVVTNG